MLLLWWPNLGSVFRKGLENLKKYPKLEDPDKTNTPTAVPADFETPVVSSDDFRVDGFLVGYLCVRLIWFFAVLRL
jgi:hypothetical protein